MQPLPEHTHRPQRCARHAGPDKHKFCVHAGRSTAALKATAAALAGSGPLRIPARNTSTRENRGYDAAARQPLWCGMVSSLLISTPQLDPWTLGMHVTQDSTQVVCFLFLLCCAALPTAPLCPPTFATTPHPHTTIVCTRRPSQLRLPRRYHTQRVANSLHF